MHALMRSIDREAAPLAGSQPNHQDPAAAGFEDLTMT
jgi:hypothetical protein